MWEELERATVSKKCSLLYSVQKGGGGGGGGGAGGGNAPPTPMQWLKIQNLTNSLLELSGDWYN